MRQVNILNQISVTTTIGTLETGRLEDLESCMTWEEEISGGAIGYRIGH